ncbi:MAG: MBL fold metallo-hydrolase [Candidatus Omnitrophica bacterium]|nr:MBL fold metallo-hydrolase [Candidatus Omnitrophota bacterium]
MTLEDHLGDILRKARRGANVTSAAAARAAGLTEAELASLEATGETVKRPNLDALAALLNLDGRRLLEIANGWLPSTVDLSRWREVRQIATSRGDNTVNCYLVWDEVTREAALFDAGWEARQVLSLLARNRLDLKYIFLTHFHDDHVAALDDLRAHSPHARIRSNSADAPPDQRNRPNDFIHLGNLRITNRETPGHSPDGVTYVVGGFPEDAPHVAVVGDALFAGSMGYGFQSSDLLRKNVREQILTLPPATLLCPGHGPLTTVAEEKAHNPFFG